MRSLILSLVLANAALTNSADPASAQSPTSYPWCVRSGDGTKTNTCYFTSKEECLRTSSGVGAFCFQSPYYRQSPPQSLEARALCQQQAQASAGAPESQDAYFDQCMIASATRRRQNGTEPSMTPATKNSTGLR
jgi:Protein of unknown function (DUF3551)